MFPPLPHPAPLTPPKENRGTTKKWLKIKDLGS